MTFNFDSKDRINVNCLEGMSVRGFLSRRVCISLMQEHYRIERREKDLMGFK